MTLSSISSSEEMASIPAMMAPPLVPVTMLGMHSFSMRVLMTPMSAADRHEMQSE